MEVAPRTQLSGYGRQTMAQTQPLPQYSQQYQAPRKPKKVPTWEYPTLSYERSLGLMPPSLRPVQKSMHSRAPFGKEVMFRAEPRYKWGTTRDVRDMYFREMPRPGMDPLVPCPVVASIPVNIAEPNKFRDSFHSGSLPRFAMAILPRPEQNGCSSKTIITSVT